MFAVTILLVVLIGAINVFSWVILDRHSDDVLHTIADRDDKFLRMDFRDRGPFLPPMNMDTVKSARFFMAHTDQDGNVLAVNIDQISSVTAEQAAQYAEQATGNMGKVDAFKYEVKQSDITEADQNRLMESLQKLSNSEDLESVVDIEQVIRYFVVHNFVCNDDSYTGMMVHNYYLYEDEGQLSMIPWDYNRGFGTFVHLADGRRDTHGRFHRP